MVFYPIITKLVKHFIIYNWTGIYFTVTLMNNIGELWINLARNRYYKNHVGDSIPRLSRSAIQKSRIFSAVTVLRAINVIRKIMFYQPPAEPYFPSIWISFKERKIIRKGGVYPERLRTPILVKPQENLGQYTTIICRHSIMSLQKRVIQPKFQRIFMK